MRGNIGENVEKHVFVIWDLGGIGIVENLRTESANMSSYMRLHTDNRFFLESELQSSTDKKVTKAEFLIKVLEHEVTATKFGTQSYENKCHGIAFLKTSTRKQSSESEFLQIKVTRSKFREQTSASETKVMKTNFYKENSCKQSAENRLLQI